jgi:glyoxylase-like metal-dependent hydrolase (beta-lactamase superfamily II)
MEARIEGVAGSAETGSANTWIVGDDEEVIVIDPGTDAGAVLAAVGEREILAVICTHGHAGHVTAAVEVAERDEAPVALHSTDRVVWREVHSDHDPDIEMEDGGSFGVADVTLEVLHAPGHSPGSVCLYCEDLGAVFTGDVLTASGPVAREDGYPDFSRQLSSIGGEVLTLPAETRILPGHGEELTVAIAEKSFDSWVAAGPGGAAGLGKAGGLGAAGGAGSKAGRGGTAGATD